MLSQICLKLILFGVIPTFQSVCEGNRRYRKLSKCDEETFKQSSLFLSETVLMVLETPFGAAVNCLLVHHMVAVDNCDLTIWV